MGYGEGVNLYSYVMDDAVNNSDPAGLATLQIGVAGSFNFPILPLATTVGFGVALDNQGHLGVYSYAGFGVGIGASVNAGLGIQVSNAKTISDLTGPFGYFSGHAGAVFGGFVDYFDGPSSHRQVVGGGVTLGAALGGSGFVWVTYTSLFTPFGDGHKPVVTPLNNIATMPIATTYSLTA